MSDPLWNFLMSRDPAKVAAEWAPVARERKIVKPRTPSPGLVGAWRKRALMAELKGSDRRAYEVERAKRVDAERRVRELRDILYRKGAA